MTRATRIGCWLACLLAAFTVTHVPPSKEPRRSRIPDTVLHFAGFAGLGLVTERLLGDPRAPRRLSGGLTLMAILLAYAAIDEWSQPLFRRSCEVEDWLADAAGAAFGLLAGVLITPSSTRWRD